MEKQREALKNCSFNLVSKHVLYKSVSAITYALNWVYQFWGESRTEQWFVRIPHRKLLHHPNSSESLRLLLLPNPTFVNLMMHSSRFITLSFTFTVLMIVSNCDFATIVLFAFRIRLCRFFGK